MVWRDGFGVKAQWRYRPLRGKAFSGIGFRPHDEMIPVKCYPIPSLELRPSIVAATRSCLSSILSGLLFAALVLAAGFTRAAIIDMTPPGFVVTASSSPSSVTMSLSGQNVTNVASATVDLTFNNGVVAWSSGST